LLVLVFSFEKIEVPEIYINSNDASIAKVYSDKNSEIIII